MREGALVLLKMLAIVTESRGVLGSGLFLSYFLSLLQRASARPRPSQHRHLSAPEAVSDICAKARVYVTRFRLDPKGNTFPHRALWAMNQGGKVFGRELPYQQVGPTTHNGAGLQNLSAGLESPTCEERQSQLSMLESPRSPCGSAQIMGFSEDNSEDQLITVRAHNKKTGEITVMRVRKGTPMKEVMSKYAESKGVRADRLSWKRRSTMRDSVIVDGTISGSHSPAGPKHHHHQQQQYKEPQAECADCGCTGYVSL